MSDPADMTSREAAAAWAARLQSPDFADWDEHASWLEADPSHPELYRRAVMAIEDGVGLLPTIERSAGANDNAGSGGFARWAWISGAVAAAAAAVVAAFYIPRAQSPQAMAYRTAAGETREVRLGDGSLASLNGDTELRTESDARRVTLVRGQVFLRVRHDQGRPFELIAGDHVARDVGTAFDATVAPNLVRISVADGAVSLDPDRSGMLLRAGRMVMITPDAELLKSTSIGAVGAWRHGRLAYRNAELRFVAMDLSRSIGVPVVVDASIQHLPFSGVIGLDASREASVAQLARALGASARRQEGGWRIVAPGER